MTWSEGSRWSMEVTLPSGVLVELKVVLRKQGAFRWYGAGPLKESNVVLETSLGRGGARASRFVGEDLPFALEVVDVAEGSEDDSKPTEAGPSAEVACRGSSMPMPGCYVAPPLQQEVSAAAMLAGVAAGAGRAVTYTTTTTTTTAVTVNGDWDGNIQGPGYMPTPCGPPQMRCMLGAPAGQPALPPAPGGREAGQGQGGRGEAAPPGGCGHGPSPGRAPEATPAQCKALAKARELNAGVPRLGPVALQWPAATNCADPEEVSVRGSWDNWGRDFAMEPAPTGGFRLLFVLPPGKYEFKFIVDGKWTISDELETTECANKNNIVYASDMALAPVNTMLAIEGGIIGTEASTALVVA